jgi:hypothetical protein
MSGDSSGNKPCWCRGGKSFKDCHGSPGAIEMIPTVFALEKVFEGELVDFCLHENHGGCRGKIVGAHSVSRKNQLEAISVGNHVYTNQIKDEFIDAKNMPGKNPEFIRKIGTRKASVFSGFCENHDNLLFSPLEDQSFIGSKKQACLLTYRALCHEVFTKRLISHLCKKLVDQVANFYPKYSVDLISHAKSYGEGCQHGLGDLVIEKEKYDTLLAEDNFDPIRGKILWLKRSPDFVSTGVTQILQDYRGNIFKSLSSPLPLAGLSISVITTGNKGAIVISWHCDSDDEAHSMFLDSLIEDKDKIIDRLFSFIIVHFENIYLSPRLWDSFSNGRKRRMNRLAKIFDPRQQIPMEIPEYKFVKWKLDDITDF